MRSVEASLPNIQWITFLCGVAKVWLQRIWAEGMIASLDRWPKWSRLVGHPKEGFNQEGICFQHKTMMIAMEEATWCQNHLRLEYEKEVYQSCTIAQVSPPPFTSICLHLHIVGLFSYFLWSFGTCSMHEMEWNCLCAGWEEVLGVDSSLRI